MTKPSLPTLGQSNANAATACPGAAPTESAGQANRHTGLRVRTIDSLDEISRESWDDLATTAGFYLSHGWLRTLESDPQSDVTYILVDDHNGSLVAALPVYTVYEEVNHRYDARRISDSGSYPELVLGGRRGYRSALMLDPALRPAARSMALNLMRNVVNDLAAGRLARFWYVPDAELGPCLEVKGALKGKELSRDATILIPPGGFAEYSARLPRGREIRRERRVFLQRGYEVSLESLSDITAEVGPLLYQVQKKYGSTKGADVYVAYYERLASSINPGEVLCCRWNGHLVGFCHFYAFGDGIWGRTVGFDYAHLQNSFEYFNLSCYELIEIGAGRGKHRLHLGIESLDAKSRRGAQIQSLWLVNLVAQESL